MDFITDSADEWKAFRTLPWWISLVGNVPFNLPKRQTLLPKADEVRRECAEFFFKFTIPNKEVISKWQRKAEAVE